jgi:HPt (histidine-containing phosphotransfer) domain-containing protein
MGSLNPRVLQELRSLQTESSPGFLAELIDLFLKEAAQHVAKLRAASEGRDLGALERAAHTLKGSSGNLGAETLSRLCARLQTAAKAAEWDGILALLADLEREYVQVEAELKAERARP